jgi:hypothetical protein
MLGRPSSMYPVCAWPVPPIITRVPTTYHFRTHLFLSDPVRANLGYFAANTLKGYSCSPLITINAPLILKMRDIIFFLRENYIMGHFKGYFEGAKTFLTPKLSRAQRGTILGSKKSRPPRNIPRNGPLCSLPETKTNNVPNFQKSAVHWYFYVPLRTEPIFVNV